MIKVITKEFREGDYAVKTTLITFFGLTIFKYRKETTNNQAVRALTVIKKQNIKGF